MSQLRAQLHAILHSTSTAAATAVATAAAAAAAATTAATADAAALRPHRHVSRHAAAALGLGLSWRVAAGRRCLRGARSLRSPLQVAEARAAQADGWEA